MLKKLFIFTVKIIRFCLGLLLLIVIGIPLAILMLIFPKIRRAVLRENKFLTKYFPNEIYYENNRGYLDSLQETRHQDLPLVKSFPSEDRNKLIEQFANYLNLYYSDNENWQQKLPDFLEKFSQLLHLDKIITEIPNSQYKQLILIPHWFLHLLPLHALPVNGPPNPPILKGITTQSPPELGDLGGKVYLQDLYEDGVSYSPSCQLLKVVKQQREKRQKVDSLFAIQNPTKDLDYAQLEVETIRNFFPNREILSNEKATETEVKSHNQLTLANCLHFSCHGEFNPTSPLESALILNKDTEQKEDGKLTLAEIFDLNLSECGLVTLSACETGVTDFQSLSDEYIGLPNGFIFAGSSSVVSSLWTVSDLSTAFLMIKFYQNYQQEKLPVYQALNKAQKWLGEINKKELNQWIKDSKIPLDTTLKVKLKRDLHKLSDDDRPFNHPSLLLGCFLCYW